MSGEVRLLGLAHGLVLGLVLACPLVAPDLLPWGIDALLLVGGFQLRLADRRFTLRPGIWGWFSHIRMAPTRLFRWGAAALAAMIVGHGALAVAILLAALACELLAYPIVTWLLDARSLSVATAALVLLITAVGLPGATALHLVACFLTGVVGCMVWLRGPDGEPRALAIALGGGVAATATSLCFPGALPFAAPIVIVCAAWILAHLSMLRRQLLPWRLDIAPVRP
ncbi:hypothetical protein [Sphingobium sp. HWE2-09]|uniref:hypothetical protein n=1 Tax=Sphingobium sp. HWE2-09 TaxID=3108390 RepID=UPI002DC298B4|nr:hypothetical protein [Sphingobium sp. HWE2-09]